MKNSLSFFRVALLVLCICLSCKENKAITPESYFSKDIKSDLISIIDDGITIEDIGKEKDLVRIVLSDGSTLFCENTLIGRIGLDGFWYVDGVDTHCLWEDVDVKTIYNDLKHFGKNNVGVDKSLLGIFEGYTAWSFYFKDDLVMSIDKSLFSYAPDSILRGVGHRGLSKEAPENTLPAFRLSRLRGFTFVETDIRFTSDGIPVLLHDEKIDRTSNGTGRVQDYSLKEIKTLDFGAWKKADYVGTDIPTFEEFLDLCCKIGLSPYIELKTGTKSQIESLVDLVDKYGLLEHSTFVSFNVNYLEYVHRYNPSVRLGMVTNSVTDKTISQAESVSGEMNDIYIGASDWSDAAVALCKNAGIPLEVWTIDSVEKVLQLPDYITGVVSNSIHAGRVIHDANK